MMVAKSFKFSDALDSRLKELATEMGVDQTDVVREGIRLVAVAVRETKLGNAIGIIAESGVAVRLVGSWDDVKRD